MAKAKRIKKKKNCGSCKHRPATTCFLNGSVMKPDEKCSQYKAR